MTWIKKCSANSRAHALSAQVEEYAHANNDREFQDAEGEFSSRVLLN